MKEATQMEATRPTRKPAAAYANQALAAEEREQLILDHLPQVRLIARRIHDRLPESVSLDDLISTGVIGLIAAIDRFDPTQNVKLKTYAEYKIRGAILDSLRGLDWAPRQQRQRAKQIEAAISSAEQRLHRTPSEEEIATELGQTIEEYHGWLVDSRGLNLGSLESVANPDDENRRAVEVRRRRRRAVAVARGGAAGVAASAGGSDREHAGHRKNGAELVLSRGADAARDFEDRGSARIAHLAVEDPGNSAASFVYDQALADAPRPLGKRR